MWASLVVPVSGVMPACMGKAEDDLFGTNAEPLRDGEHPRLARDGLVGGEERERLICDSVRAADVADIAIPAATGMAAVLEGLGDADWEVWSATASAPRGHDRGDDKHRGDRGERDRVGWLDGAIEGDPADSVGFVMVVSEGSGSSAPPR